MISVVIPLYNKEKQIAHTLQSVLRQTFQDFEIVIVNDGSTDHSVEEVKKVQDARIRLIHQQNAGVSAARNRGIREAKYDLIAFLDADDEWKPKYLETQYGLYQKYPECSVYACNYEFRNSEGKVTPTIIRKLPFQGEDGVLRNYFEVASCSHPPICSISIMVKKEAIQTVGGFPVGIKSGEDLLTWARLAVKYKIAYCKLPLASFSQDPSHNINQIPTRLHDNGDPVGIALQQLLPFINESQKKYFRHYLSLWYKMRTSVFLRVYDIKNTMKYGRKSLSYNMLNTKVYLMMIMVLFPKSIQQIIKNKYNA